MEAKGKIYEHERGLMEHECGMRLSQEADAMRREAGNTEASEDEVLALLDMTKQDYDKMMTTLKGFEKNMTGLWIEEKLKESGLKTEGAAAKMLVAVNHSMEEFKADNHALDDHQFLVMLSRVLNQTKSELISFQQTKDKLEDRLRHWDVANGEKLTYNLAVALQGVTDSIEFRNHLSHIDSASLAHASMSEACGLLSNLVHDNMHPAYKSVGLQKQKLDDMSKIAPIVIQRLHCSIKSASARAGLALAALLSAAVA